MKRIILFSFTAAILSACGTKEDQHTGSKENQETSKAFDAFKERFIEEMWKFYPGWASSVGYHTYDSVLIIPTEQQREKEIAFANAYLDSLKKFPLEQLSSNSRTDLQMIQNQLESTVWSINYYRSYEWNPAEYNVMSGISELLSSNHDKLGIRLHNIFLRLQNTPAYYDAAIKNIKNPTLVHTKLGIDQNINSLSVLEKDLVDSLNKSSLKGSPEMAEYLTGIQKAVESIKNYANYLQKLKNETPRSLHLGKELHAQKFKYDIQSRYTADEIYARAVQRKKELHKEMYKLALGMFSKYKSEVSKEDSLKMIREVIDAISVNHAHRDSFQESIEKQLSVLVEFINNKDLITLDPSKPLVIRKEPAYMAGVAPASINSPGPYDKGANTYYNVASLKSRDKDDAESFLREYNSYTLQILNIHEALPGHYAQLIYSNESPSIIKSIFGCNTMIEGWAVYTERMMMESGYGNTQEGQISPELWLMYYKWHLRTVCNTILDYSVHELGMEEKEAMNLLINEAFQQEAEAKGKWRRVSLTQVQLCSYFTGYSEIYDLREELKQKMGDKFNLKQFHEKFLSYGSAPVKYIRELMIEELNKPTQTK